MPFLKNAKREIVAKNVADGKADYEACLAAGYSESTSRTQSTRIVQRPEIQSRIVEILQSRLDATLIDATKLHRQWSDMQLADIGDIMLTAECECPETERPKCIRCAGSGRRMVGYKPIHLWPKIWRQMLAGMDVKELMERSKDGEGASWDKIGEVVKLKFVSVKDLGDLLGRHKAVDAFVQQKNEEHVHLHLHEEISNRIAAGRQRAAQRNANRREHTKVAS